MKILLLVLMIASHLQAEDLLDVAIIGAGQCGVSLAFSLQNKGINKIELFDRAAEGREGPWLTTARMKTLRSAKDIPGPALNFPHLSFRAWYEKTYQEDWETIGKIPTLLWGQYLNWYRKGLNLPINNGWELLSIIPEGESFKLIFNEGRERKAKRVVVATGREGYGGFEIPSFMNSIDKSHWFHTGERIESKNFRGKRICVIGAAASAFDAAAMALEFGAKQVEMIVRRKELPTMNPFAFYKKWPAFYELSDEEHLQFFEEAWKAGTSLPDESIERLEKWNNFAMHFETEVNAISYENELVIETNQGLIRTDMIILGTGYAIDSHSVPFLTPFADQILHWGDIAMVVSPKLARFPYLGAHFELLEKNPGPASYLKKIYIFNYGSFLSHGRLAGDIDVLPIGVERLTDGILTDLKLETYPNG